VREPVDRSRVEAFLRELGRRFPQPVRVLVTGGASMILRDLRGLTQDIDLTYTIAAEHDGRFNAVLRELKDSLRINVELAEPGHFIPIPAGRDSRLSYFDRYGRVEVFLDDPYSIALSKLHRGHDQDLEDVGLLIQAGLADAATLEAKAREIADSEGPRVRPVDLEKLLARLDRVRKSP
jgi:hypothetical protein